MATLQELMSECFGETPTGAVKEASAKTSTTREIDEVLSNLGLDNSESIKVASEASATETKETGGTMGLTDIYEQIMSGDVAMDKVASEATYENEATAELGELVGEYFNTMIDAYMSKVAEEAQPMEDLEDAEEEMPHLPVNQRPTLGKSIDTSTGGTSPYSLKEKALVKAILSRMQAGQVGAHV